MRKTIKNIFWEASLFAGTLGFAETFFPPFAISLAATPLQLGLLSSLPSLSGSLLQIKVPDLLDSAAEPGSQGGDNGRSALPAAAPPLAAPPSAGSPRSPRSSTLPAAAPPSAAPPAAGSSRSPRSSTLRYRSGSSTFPQNDDLQSESQAGLSPSATEAQKDPGAEISSSPRRRLYLPGALLNALFLLPLIFLGWGGGGWRIWLFILFVSLYSMAAGVVSPPFASLLSDLVPERIRGTILGIRNRVMGISTLVSAFVGGSILHVVGQVKTLPSSLGFSLIFFLAFLCRIGSMAFMSRLKEPSLGRSAKWAFTFFEFLKRMTGNNFGRFVLYVSMIQFSMNIAGPFFPLYMLRELHLSYFHYTILVTTFSLINLLAMPYWGKTADRHGNMKVLTIGGVLVPILPLLWLVSQNFYWLIGVQFFAGLSWAAFTLSSINFIYDSVIPQRRPRCIAYYNIFNGISLFLGSLVSSLLLSGQLHPLPSGVQPGLSGAHSPLQTGLPYPPGSFLPMIFGSPLPFLFLLSGLLRGAASLYWLPRLKEVRHVKPMTTKELLLNLSGIRPALDIAMELVGRFRS